MKRITYAGTMLLATMLLAAMVFGCTAGAESRWARLRNACRMCSPAITASATLICAFLDGVGADRGAAETRQTVLLAWLKGRILRWLQLDRCFGYRSGQISLECGCSSGVEHDLAKVGVEGSNPFARSNT